MGLHGPQRRDDRRHFGALSIDSWGAMFVEMVAYELIVDDTTFVELDTAQPETALGEEPVDPPSEEPVEPPSDDVPESGHWTRIYYT